MSESVKTTSGAHAVARSNLYRAAIVGAASLKGKEIAEMLNERNFPAVDVRLLDDDESLGQLEAMGDEISFIQSVRAEQFEHVDFTFFAADADCTRKNWKRALRGIFGFRHTPFYGASGCIPDERRFEDFLAGAALAARVGRLL